MLSTLPLNIRSLVVILILSAFSFFILKRTVCLYLPSNEYNRWRNIWFALVIFAFVINDFALFIPIVIGVLFLSISNNCEQKVTYYFLLLCILPKMSLQIPGFGVVNYIFDLTYNRLLIILLLVPLLYNNKKSQNSRFESPNLVSDKLVLFYVLLCSILSFRDNSITNGLRESFILFLDIYIPYYIISRNIYSLKQFNTVLFAFLVGMMPLAIIAIIETAKHWHLYQPIMTNAVGMDSRSGLLRASAVFVSPIALGYALTIIFGIYIYLRPYFVDRKINHLLTFIIILGLLSTISRGPWVGLTVLIITYVLNGAHKLKYIFKGLLALCIILPIILILPVGDKFIELLPFIGTTETGTIDYRERLFEQAWIVFNRNPVFGSTTFLNTPELQSLTWGGWGGIVDLVNNYVQIGLSTGISGLALFIAFFFSLLLGTHRSIIHLPQKEIDMIRLGRILFACIVSILIMIGTVSDIDYIPAIYWAIAGLSAAYIRRARCIIKNNTKSNFIRDSSCLKSENLRE